MSMNNQIVEASKKALAQPLRVVGIVKQSGEYFAIAGDAGILAAAAKEGNVRSHSVEGGFFGSVPWISVAAYEFPAVHRALAENGFVPSILEIADEPEKPEAGIDPFSSEEAPKAELAIV